MSIELGTTLKPSYDISIKAILFNFTSTEKQTSVYDGIRDIDFNNIDEFSIDSNPKKMSVNIYNLKLKNIMKSYQDMFLNTNLVFYIKIVEKIPFDDSVVASVVLENYFKIYSYEYDDSGATLYLDYNLVSFNTAALLFSQRYNTDASQTNSLITIDTTSHLIQNIMGITQNHFASNLNLLLEEYSKIDFAVVMPVPKDIVFRNQLNTSGLNSFAYNNVRLPIRNDLNDITIINYILNNYKLYFSPTWFIFDDSRMGNNYSSTVEVDTAAIDPVNEDDISKSAARIYTYVFINTFNIKSLPTVSCWNTEDLDAFKVSEGESTKSNVDNKLDVVVGQNFDYVPVKAHASEFRLGSRMHRMGSVINGDDLKAKARSRVILRNSKDDTTVVEPARSWNNGLVNTIRIDTDIPADVFLISLKCEKFLMDNDASIYSATFHNMRYNVLDYNVTYDLVSKLKHNYVLFSFNKKFTFNGETRAFNMKTDAEFLYLPDTIAVDIKTISSTSSTGNLVPDIVNNITSGWFGSNTSNMPRTINMDEFKLLTPEQKAQALKELAQNVADNVKYSKTQTGKASYYNAKSADSRFTANGEIFDDQAQTCASNTYPFNTILLVTNKDTGLSTVVRVNDTGGFQSGKHADSGRVIDLTEGAAKSINMVKAGIANVEIQVLEWGDGKRVKK